MPLPSAATLEHLLRRIAHYGVYVVGGAAIVVASVALALKLWVMPDINRFRPDVEAAATRAVGVPVHIGEIRADWQGIHPRLSLLDVRLQPEQGEAGTPLVLPRVDAVGSWFSLALLQPRLRRIDLIEPRFPLRRTSNGVIYLAGIALNVPSQPSPFPDWLLSQPRIVIKNAEITWLDEQQQAPLLRVSQVRLLLENRFGRHRFGGVALPSHAASRIDLRGDLKGKSVHAPNTWSGQIFAQVSQADLASWGQWVPWAQQSVKQGQGDLRFWLDMERAEVTGLKGDAHLRNTSVNLQAGLPDLQFETLSGRMGWSRKRTAHTLLVEKLRFKAPGSPPSEPANLVLTLTPDDAGGFRRIEGRASSLRLEALTAFTTALPLPGGSHGLIASLSPRGFIEVAEGYWDNTAKNAREKTQQSAQDYKLHLKIQDAGALGLGSMPAFSGLNATLEAGPQSGGVTLNSRQLRVLWPQIFRHELALTHLDAQGGWARKADGMHINFNARRLANADLEGSTEGHIVLPTESAKAEGGKAKVDISGHLSRGEATAVYRYLPLGVGDAAYQWVKRGLIAGQSDDVKLKLKGDLKYFPFDKGGGDFSVSINMLDGVLDYAEGWPRIEGVRGNLLFHNQSMTLQATAGRMLEASLGPVRVEIPDLHYTIDEEVLIDGEARGQTQTFIDFIHQSPVNEHTNFFTEGFKAEGNGVLALKLRLPVRRLANTTVGGAFSFQDGRLQPGPGIPLLTHLQGSFAFTEKSLQGKDIQMRVLDMPAALSMASQQGEGVRVQLNGTASTDVLRPYLPAALASRLQGSAQWQADLGLKAKGQTSALNIRSDLVGMTIDLPAPIGKPSTHALPLQLTHQPQPDGSYKINASYGTWAKVRAHWPKNAEARINVRLGGADPNEPTEAGLWIGGNQRFLDLDAWRTLDWQADTASNTEENRSVFRQASLGFSELQLFNRRLHDTHLRLQPNGKGWLLQIAGKELNGDLTTVPDARGTRVLANFKRLALPEASTAPAGHAAAADTSTASTKPSRLSHLDLNVQSLAWKGRELGELRVRLSPVKTGLLVDNLLLTLPEGRIGGSGLVSDNARRPTRLSLDLGTQNLGKLLARLGYEDAIKGGEATLIGNISWMGGPEDFSLDTLDGDLEIKSKQGQFLKVDPGAGRLVGVLSLQSLPRRISLDFRDVFSQGFAFDEIDGKVHLENGSAYTQDLRMNGPAAKIRMSGVVNLKTETQNLKLQIQPRLEDSVALAGALIGGPAVGIGTLIANKILKNPIGQITSFEYAVSGGWADPVITKVPKASKADTAKGQDAEGF